MKRKLIIEIISALFIVFFVHTAISCFIRIQSLKNLLAFYTPHITGTAWTIVLTEAVIVLLLVIRRTRTIGLLLSLLFMLGLGITVWLTPHYPHDFGGILNDKPERQLILIAITGSVLALVAILLGIKSIKKANRLEEIPVVYT